MIFPSNRVRIMVATKPVDFRKGHDGLAALVSKRLAEGVGLEVPGHKRLDFRDRPALSNAGQCL
nr:IS66 family insertion sequence hypothetical protein [Rhizobium sp. P007]